MVFASVIILPCFRNPTGALLPKGKLGVNTGGGGRVGGGRVGGKRRREGGGTEHGAWKKRGTGWGMGRKKKKRTLRLTPSLP